jgi:DNA-binding NarL/FixJ family response regulator
MSKVIYVRESSKRNFFRKTLRQMTDKKRIIIVDDQDFFREGLTVLFNKSESVEVVAEAGNGKEFLEIVNKHNPDAVIMDINMPVMDGIEATRQAMKTNPDLKVIVLSMFCNEEQYLKMIGTGVKGFVLKSSAYLELEKAILEVTENRNYFSEEVRNQIIMGINNLIQNSRKNQLVTESLTLQEIDILKLIVAGLPREQIAKKINLSIASVEQNHKSIINKTLCNNSASLVMFAISNKLVEVE